MRVVGPCVGVALVLVVGAGCGARTGLDDEVRDGAIPTPVPEGGTDTFPCRWTVGSPLELERDPSEICAINGAISATASEALLVYQDVSCDLAPFEGVPAVIADLADPPRVITGGGTMPHPFGHFAGITEGYLFAESSPVVRLYSSRMELIEEQATDLTEVFGIDRIDSNRVYGRPAEGPEDIIVAWSTRAHRRVGPALDTASPGFVRAQLLPGDVWIGVSDRFLYRQHPGREPFLVDLPPSGSVDSITPDYFNPGIALLGTGERVSDVFRVSAEREGAPTLDRLSSPVGALAIGPIASNETEALVPMSDGTILIQRMNGAPAGRLPFTDDDAGQARVLLRPNSSVGGIFSIERIRASGENVVRFRPMVCNR